MLYVSTRNKLDSYTAYRALHEDNAPDGGSFVPFHLIPFTQDELNILKEKTFSEAVAQILNLFFSCRLSSWDVEFCIGRYPHRIELLNQRIAIAELWHNTQDTYRHLVQSLYQKISGETDRQKEVPQWFQIAIETAMLFGLYAELQKNGVESIDVAVTADDFLYPISAWYAREMGLPIDCIICGCSESSNIWDFLQRGELDLSRSVSCAVLTGCLERLLYNTLGAEQIQLYLDACESGQPYILTEEELNLLNSGFFAAVIGKKRIGSVINSIYRTNTYIADPATAVSYGALQDYRAQTGENRLTLLMARCNPMLNSNEITSAIGLSEDELRAMIRYSGE